MESVAAKWDSNGVGPIAIEGEVRKRIWFAG